MKKDEIIYPEALKPGDSIGIVSTARKISREELQPAIDQIKKWGFEVVLGENLFAEHHQFAGTAEQRLSDFQQMLDNPKVRAILCARGGYGTVQIIDQIDFSKFRQNPKWICGYSDVTVLHNHIYQNCGVTTLHSTMPINFAKNTPEALQSLYDALTGKKPKFEFTPEEGSRSGTAKGQMIGGNLSILYSLTGTPSHIDTSGQILFLEDLDEYLYHIDRMMMNLKRAGMIENLAGLIIGGMTDMNDNTIPYGYSAKETILEHVKDYDFPVAFGFPSGHLDGNLTWVHGGEVEMEVGTNKIVVS
ncbi:S66 peptidase family protein [Halocola ammonii]